MEKEVDLVRSFQRHPFLLKHTKTSDYIHRGRAKVCQQTCSMGLSSCIGRQHVYERKRARLEERKRDKLGERKKDSLGGREGERNIYITQTSSAVVLPPLVLSMESS